MPRFDSSGYGSSSTRTSGRLRLSWLGCAVGGLAPCQVELAQSAICVVPEVFGGGQALPQRVGAAGDGGVAGGPFPGELCVQGCALVPDFCEGLATGVRRVGRPTACLFGNVGLGSAFAAAWLGAVAGARPMIIRHVRQNDSSSPGTPCTGALACSAPVRALACGVSLHRRHSCACLRLRGAGLRGLRGRLQAAC